MTKRIDRNLNTSDEPTINTVTLNSSTSTTVAVAFEKRIKFSLSNPSNKRLYLKEQAASIDNDKKGHYIQGNGFWEMEVDNPHTGEFSAIAESGSPTISYTES